MSDFKDDALWGHPELGIPTRREGNNGGVALS